MLKDICRGFSPAQNHGLALRLAVAGGIEQRAFERDLSGICKKRGFKTLGTIRHEELL
jgi:hypothetical protein